MSISRIQGVEGIDQWPRKQTWLLFDPNNRKNSKITGFVLDRLGSSNSFGRATILPEAFASRVMIDVLSTLAAPIRNRNGAEARYHLRKKRSKPIDSLAPLGLQPSSLCEWANAWILFLIHLPKFTELVSFAGKSFEPFRIFVDQYLFDQKEGRSVSVADSSSLIRCFSHIYPLFLSRFSRRIDLYEIFRSLFKSLFFPMTLDVNAGFYDSIVFHPDWVMVWDGISVASFNEQMQNILHSHPSEMMIAVKHCGHFAHSTDLFRSSGSADFTGSFEKDSNGRGNIDKSILPSSFESKTLQNNPENRRTLHFERCHIQRQIFLNGGRCFYDLDAFIECRPDAKGVHFVTYLRIDGMWYQCDDEKVRNISSRTLSVPLSRGVLFHYKRAGI